MNEKKTVKKDEKKEENSKTHTHTNKEIRSHYIILLRSLYSISFRLLRIIINFFNNLFPSSAFSHSLSFHNLVLNENKKKKIEISYLSMYTHTLTHKHTLKNLCF